MSKARPPFSARGIPSSVAPTATLRRHVEALEVSAKGRFEAGAKKAKVRRFKEFYDGAASWSRVERIIARVEAGEEGADARFIVTNLAGGRPKAIYEDIYCRRGCAENHIKSWKTHLAATARRAARPPPISSACSCMPSLSTENAALSSAALKAARVSMFKVCTSIVRRVIGRSNRNEVNKDG